MPTQVTAVVATHHRVVPGDRLVVYEVPNCRLDPDDLRLEPSAIAVAPTIDGPFTSVAVEHPGGDGSFEVPPPGDEDVPCEPCRDPVCEP